MLILIFKSIFKQIKLKTFAWIYRTFIWLTGKRKLSTMRFPWLFCNIKSIHRTIIELKTYIQLGIQIKRKGRHWRLHWLVSNVANIIALFSHQILYFLINNSWNFMINGIRLANIKILQTSADSTINFIIVWIDDTIKCLNKIVLLVRNQIKLVRWWISTLRKQAIVFWNNLHKVDADLFSR